MVRHEPPSQGHRTAQNWHSLYVGCCDFFPIKDSFLKAQDPAVPALLAISFYFFVQMSIGFCGLHITRHTSRANPFAGMTGLHILRSVTLTCSLATFFFSLRFVPLSTAVTLFTLQSLFCIGFGRIILNEPIHRRHLILVACAMVGVLLVAQPDGSGAGFGFNLLPLLSGAFGGLYIIITRKLGTRESPLQLVCQDGGTASLSVLFIYLVGNFIRGDAIPPVVLDPLTFLVPPLLAATIGMISSFAMIRAAQLAPAAKLAPACYLEIASGAVIGILIFDEYLDLPKIIGIFIIVAVCLTNTLMNEIKGAQKNCR
jgi:drug/metabolite transporter (DMT)-like permease